MYMHVFGFVFRVDVVRSFHVGFDLEKRVYLKYNVSWVFGICECNNNTISYKQTPSVYTLGEFC